MPPARSVKIKRAPKAKPATAKAPRRTEILAPRLSSGYLVRDAHRAFQRLLERRIAPHGVSRGHGTFCACCGPPTGYRSVNCRRAWA
jgi:hypothetical protein